MAWLHFLDDCAEINKMLNTSIESLSTLHSSLPPHSSLFTLHSPLFTLHSSLFTLHSSLPLITLHCLFHSNPNAAGVGVEIFSQGESLDGPMMFEQSSPGVLDQVGPLHEIVNAQG